ncbi:MAG TPA: FtsQ-type POTRA domain-containing protein [Actinomycetota bacterium]|nr:FtsQ-type POTRA domain-containing protein [Actinomycetota bacterium]
MASSIASPSEGRDATSGGLWRRARRPLAIGVAGVVLTAAAIATTRTGLFRVRGIDVEGAAHRSRAQIVRLSGVTRYDNAIWLDGSSVEARLLRDPWIARADVRVDFPWSVTITVTERSAIAWMREGTEPALVAGDGTILGPGDRSGLPSIDAPPAWIDPSGSEDVSDAARALIALGTDLRSRIDRVVVGGPTGLELVLTDGLRVRFGAPGNDVAKATVLEEVLTWMDEAGGKFRAIDVSAPSAPTVTPSA